MQMYDVQDDEAYMNTTNFKFKIGDKVKIIDNLKAGNYYDDDILVTKEMFYLAGKEGFITEYVHGAEDYIFGYRLDIDEDNFTWSDSMLEPAVEDNVNHPSHYNNGKIEVIDFIEDKGLNFNLGNSVKYICRCDIKYNGEKALEDLKKALWYLNREIASREKGL